MVIFMKLSRDDKTAKFKDIKFTALRYAMKCPCGLLVESSHMSTVRAIKEIESKMKEHIASCPAYKA
jgi:hypothetical protein